MLFMLCEVIETIIEDSDCFGKSMYKERQRFNGKSKARKYLEDKGYKEKEINHYEKFYCEEDPHEGDIWYECSAIIK